MAASTTFSFFHSHGLILLLLACSTFTHAASRYSFHSRPAGLTVLPEVLKRFELQSGAMTVDHEREQEQEQEPPYIARPGKTESLECAGDKECDEPISFARKLVAAAPEAAAVAHTDYICADSC